MVDKHFRWDFIGLSTDEKPTPETSTKVVDGSTYYTSDDSKLYIWYKDQWYERKPIGDSSYYEGKNLGDYYTLDQLSAKVQAGDFSGIHVGDYITKTVKVGSGTEREEDFVVADFDYFLGIGDTPLDKHHIVMIPKHGFYELARMNGSNTSTGGYNGSNMHGTVSISYVAGSGGSLTDVAIDYTGFVDSPLQPTASGYAINYGSDGHWSTNSIDLGEDLTDYGITYTGTPVQGDSLVVLLTLGNLEPYRRAIYEAFGTDHILEYRSYQTTSTSSGIWTNARVELMNECMVYGGKIYANNNEGERFAPIQLKYFAEYPNSRLGERAKSGVTNAMWLSSIYSTTTFCTITNVGLPYLNNASTQNIVRPYFLFG